MKEFLARIDVGRAIVALIIAIVLFTFVRNEANPAEIASFEVPVDYVDAPLGLLIAPGQAPPGVRVRVSGPRDTVGGIRSGAVRAYVDLRRGRSGIEEYRVSVELPDPRVRLIDVIPAEIPVRLEEIIERRVPVRVSRSGNVPFGYDAGAIQVEPSEVVASGPSSVLQRTASAALDLKLDGATVNIDGTYGLTPLDPQGQSVPMEGRAVRFTPETVRVRVPITQQLSYKTVPVRPTIAGAPDSGFAIEALSVDPPVVTVAGSTQTLGAIEVAQTQQVDVGDASVTFTRQVALLVPEGTSVVGQDSVRVSVRIGALVVLQPLPVPLSVDDVPPGLQVVGALPTIQVVLRGPASTVRSVDPARFRAAINLGGREPGLHEVSVNVAAPGDLTIESFAPRAVAVRLAGPEPAPAASPPAAT